MDRGAWWVTIQCVCIYIYIYIYIHTHIILKLPEVKFSKIKERMKDFKKRGSSKHIY